MADTAALLRGPGRTGPVRSLARGILLLRLGAAAVTAPTLAHGDPGLDAVLPALLIASLGTLIPLFFWRRVIDAVLRHPALLGLDVAWSGVVLLLVGTTSPFLLVTVGSAALAGLLYGRVGAAAFTFALASGYWVALAAQPAAIRADPGAWVTVPLLYALTAAAAVGVRGVFARQAATEDALADARERAAASEERARLARDMHDSLGKTLHGIALAATALARRVARRAEGDPDTVAAADGLARAALAAGEEARTLISGLRDDDPSCQPLSERVEEVARDWAQRSGHELVVDLEPVGAVAAPAVREMVAILSEALRNVERHAGAASVEVGLHAAAGQATLTVRDDGAGFDPDGDRLAAGGHYGLLGMTERAALAGGRLEVDSAPGAGTTVTVRFPAVQAFPPAPSLEVLP